jgi:hypothetical protein
MKTFTERFFKVLVTEQEDPAVEADRIAAAAELDAGTDPAMLDVQDVPDGAATPLAGSENPASELQKQQNVQYAEQINGWVVDIEEFINYLNGLGEESLNSQINNAPCDTIFDDIARSETKKIGRIAQDLRSLSESLKSYLISND